MIRLSGKALVATWRPYEQGGASMVRTSQVDSDYVTVCDQIVIAQHHDGFWATYPLSSSTVIWREKPTVTVITEDCREIPLALQGQDDTLAAKLSAHQFGMRTPIHAMGSSESAIEGSQSQEMASSTGARESGENG